MPEGKEEIYSIMFSSLKHPVRRKILRVLADKPLAFSDMLELLGISSSNLTYHLDSLGELVSKDETGVYRLSTFGQASVSTMKIVEEVPQVQTRKQNGKVKKWRIVAGALLICVVIFASLSAMQINAASQAQAERDTLQSRYDQLLSWTTTTDDAIEFLQSVVQIDTNHYHATLMSRTVETRNDLGGLIEENMQYSLTSDDSKMQVFFRYRNNELSRYQLVILDGVPVYSQAQSHIVLDQSQGVLARYLQYQPSDYLANMSAMMNLVKTNGNTEIKQGNIKLNATITNDEDAQITMMYTENNVDFSPKSVAMTFQGRALTELVNGWYLFTIGSTNVKISSDRAVELAKNVLNGYSWTAPDGQVVSHFNILSEPSSVTFHPNTKNGVALYPQWVVIFYLDKVYPGDIYRISVGIWADTGDIAQIETLNT
jgi:hypothetical protein